jgi:hypothetical protein
MNTTQINLKIAEIKGLKPYPFEAANNDGSVWVNTGKNFPEVFDYINDWNHLGPLVVELLDNKCSPKKWGHLYHWYDNDDLEIRKDKDFGLATCLAWLKEKGVEV